MVIAAENITKEYRLGALGGTTLKEDLSRWWAQRRNHSASIRGGPRNDGAQTSRKRFLALNDVSFDVQDGEVLGIIGRNGAGKSTLLKILSQVTAPTRGEVKIKGRIASLLEVGTGFHPDLTGRENIFLNGAILGMTKGEIRSKFDEIVDFAGIDEFLDSPVKRYSSGMYVRLAFAVAAHLEPEILVVDEVLAVGDADFQKKCMGKMHDVSEKQGRTVLFVSHQIGMITSLCSRALLLEKGVLSAVGDPSTVVNRYFGSSHSAPHVIDFREERNGPGDTLGRLLYACIEDERGRPVHEVEIGDSFEVRMDFEVLADVPRGPYPNFHFFDSRGEYAFVAAASELVTKPVSRGVYTARCHVPGHLMNNGIYTVGLGLTFQHNGTHVSFWDRQGLSLSIVDRLEETLLTSRAGYVGQMPGLVRPNLDWSVDRIE